MRKLIFIGFIVAGSAVGLLSTLGNGWGLKLFMMCLGALVGAAAGGALSRVCLLYTSLRFYRPMSCSSIPLFLTVDVTV